MRVMFDFVYYELAVHVYPPSVTFPSGYGPTTQKKEEKY